MFAPSVGFFLELVLSAAALTAPRLPIVLMLQFVLPKESFVDYVTLKEPGVFVFLWMVFQVCFLKGQLGGFTGAFLKEPGFGSLAG